MSDKYYTPDISEFHVGFDFEVNLEGGWFGVRWNEGIAFDNVLAINDDPAHCWTLSLKIKAGLIRVKHLDRSDIEECGWKFIPYLPKGDGDYRWFELFNLKDYSIALNVPIKPIGACVIHKGISVIYEGTILNKSELIFQMKRLNIKL